MIIGIGTDLVDIRRIGQTLGRFGDRFVCRIFTEHEQNRAERRANKVAVYARRFAAKEACAKALGTGLHRGVFWRDMGVVNLVSGQPTLILTGGAMDRLSNLTPEGWRSHIHLALSDEFPMASAFVTISASPCRGDSVARGDS